MSLLASTDNTFFSGGKAASHVVIYVILLLHLMAMIIMRASIHFAAVVLALEH